jgi:hypothetical protein
LPTALKILQKEYVKLRAVRRLWNASSKYSRVLLLLLPPPPQNPTVVGPAPTTCANAAMEVVHAAAHVLTTAAPSAFRVILATRSPQPLVHAF